MKFTPLAAVALLTCATAGHAQMAAPLPATITPATITLSAEAKVAAAPDIADIGAGVVTQATDASAALAANATRMSAVVAALKRAGVAARDIQTSALNLQPQYRYADNQPPTLTGYQASNRVSVALRELGGAGRIIDTLVAQGANQIDGPSFRLDKPEPLLDQARGQAVATLRARAQLYAAAAGLRVKRIVSISESGPLQSPMPRPMMQSMARAEKADSPVAPGEVDVGVSVTMAFELE